MNTAVLFSHKRSTLFGPALFLAVVLFGAAYIVWAKLAGVHPVQVAVIPLLLMVFYALLIGLARYFRVRDDQAGDNLYYLGFLYTLTSLGVSLYQFSLDEGAENIVTNFGIAIASTILGVTLRVVFNQMRQDPLEVERTARLELADAARRVKLELDAATFEFTSFRRATQQVSEESVAEARKHAERLEKELSEAIKNFPVRCAEPLEAASEQTRQTVDKLAVALTERLEHTGNHLTARVESLASTADTVTSSFEEIQSRLRAMRTPEEIIEIKLQPFIGGLTKVVNKHANTTVEQMGELQSIIARFGESVKTLADRIAEEGHNRQLDQQFLRELVSRLEAASAETRQLLTDINKKVSGRPLRAPRRNALLLGWFKGSA
jgi:archaellum component FlaC